jgi:hypothetical protein
MHVYFMSNPSLVPDEIGQETLADARAGGPVVDRSELSLKSEAKKNEQITRKLLPYNVWCTLTVRGGLMSRLRHSRVETPLHHVYLPSMHSRCILSPLHFSIQQQIRVFWCCLAYYYQNCTEECSRDAILFSPINPILTMLLGHW